MTITETVENDTEIVALEGDADLAAVPAFQEIMRSKTAGKTPRLVLDFSAVTFVNTPIWAVVVEYYQGTLASESAFAIAGLKDRVEASFNIVRLGEFIGNYPTVTEAIAALSSPS